MDVFEMDAASEAGVEDVRSKIVQVADYRPNYCRYKIYIIDEVHDLSAKAFDALLKTIEEPPGHVVFVLATTEYSKVPATIRSRCQKYDFHRATLADLVGRLQWVCEQEGIEADVAALTVIARAADGGYRDALTLLEQASLASDGVMTSEVVYDQLGLVQEGTVDALLEAICGGDVAKIIECVDEVIRTGRDTRALIESMLYRISDLTRAGYGVESTTTQDVALEAALKSLASRIGVGPLTHLRAKIAELQRSVREVTLPKLWLEAELTTLALAPAQSAQPKAVVAPAVTVPSREAPKAEAVREQPAPNPPAPRAAAPTDDPELARARSAWAKVVNELATMSNVMRECLAQTEVETVAGSVATVVFQRETMHDKIVENSKRALGVQQKWAEHITEPKLTLAFSFSKNGNGGNSNLMDDAAVELPVEGKKLEQLAREVFDS